MSHPAAEPSWIVKALRFFLNRLRYRFAWMNLFIILVTLAINVFDVGTTFIQAIFISMLPIACWNFTTALEVRDHMHQITSMRACLATTLFTGVILLIFKLINGTMGNFISMMIFYVLGAILYSLLMRRFEKVTSS